MKTEELKELFMGEALNHHEELNRLFTELEQDLSNSGLIDHIFRRLHTLKGDAAGMGFQDIAEMAHTMEDLFGEMKKHGWIMEKEDFNHLFRALDKLGELLDALKTGQKVSYKGLRAKLKLLLDNAQASRQDAPLAQPERPPAPPAPQADTPLPTPTPAATSNEDEADDSTKKASKITFAEAIQVPVKKLDDLMKLVGELAIEKDRIANDRSQGQSRLNTFDRLNRITSDLQYSVMGARLVRVELLFQKFHRIVRDVAHTEGKEVELILKGTDIEIDRNVLQTISDSMIHLVRNAVSHGLEEPHERQRVGKPTKGTIRLEANNLKDSVVIQVADDGRGIDPERVRQKAIERGLFSESMAQKLTEKEVIDLIFEPNFSLKEKVTAVSGRGVGMDVVRNAIDQIGGSIQIRTALGVGTSFALRLPASMAVKNALLFVLNEAEFAIPLAFTEAVIAVPKSRIHRVGQGLMTTHQEKTISVIFLRDVFAVQRLEDLYQARRLQQSFSEHAEDDLLNMIIVQADNRSVGLVVDRLLQQKEIIEKPLVKPLESIYFFSGATILGNGNVCLILDIPNLIKILFRTSGLLTHQETLASSH